MKTTLNGISLLNPVPHEFHVRSGALNSLPVSRNSGKLPQSPAIPPPVEPAIGTVVFPVYGITRRTVGHVAILDEDLTLLKATAGYPAVPFEIDGEAVLLVSVVDAKPLVDTRENLDVTEGANRNAWVLTLSDPRYHLDSIVHDGVSPGADATYETLLTDLADRMSLTLPTLPTLTAPPSDSGHWSGDALKGYRVSEVFDCLCATLGLRAVWDATTGDLSSLQLAEQAQTTHDAFDFTNRGSEGGLKWAFHPPATLDATLYDASGNTTGTATVGSGDDHADAELPDGDAAWPGYLLGEWTDWGANTVFVGTFVGGQFASDSGNHSFTAWFGDSTHYYGGETERGLSSSRTGVGSGTDYRNTTDPTVPNVGVKTINEFDNASGIYGEAGTTPDRNKTKLYAASYTQAGAVSTGDQTYAGVKGFDEVVLNLNVGGGGTIPVGSFVGGAVDNVYLWLPGSPRGFGYSPDGILSLGTLSASVSVISPLYSVGGGVNGISRTLALNEKAVVGGGIVIGYAAVTTYSLPAAVDPATGTLADVIGLVNTIREALIFHGLCD